MEEFIILVFLSSGLFLGWSLGANDAANVFGAAVGTKMIKFRTAAIIGSIFVILGAVISGAGASHTLGKLGAVNTLPGAFTVALSAGFTVFWMTRLKLPVSTSQAIVGAIIGWNLFTGNQTDMNSLVKIVLTWIICPLLSAGFSLVFYYIIRFSMKRASIHMIRQDAITRSLLILAGAFGAYSLGANNIANVMGVFIPVSPFGGISFAGGIKLNGVQMLFLLGGLAISAGIITYSKRVMLTISNGIFKLSPITAFIVVLSSSLVLFLFASQGLKDWLITHGLPSLPLVPVSSSQAVVGAVLGIGIAKSARNIDYRIMGRISSGWVMTPIAAGLLSFFLLFVMQNLFLQSV